MIRLYDPWLDTDTQLASGIACVFSFRDGDATSDHALLVIAKSWKTHKLENSGNSQYIYIYITYFLLPTSVQCYASLLPFIPSGMSCVSGDSKWNELCKRRQPAHYAFYSKCSELCKRRQPAHFLFIPSGMSSASGDNRPICLLFQAELEAQAATTAHLPFYRLQVLGQVVVAVASVFCTVHVFVCAQISAEP